MATERHQIVTELVIDASALKRQADEAAATIDKLGQKITGLGQGVQATETTVDASARTIRRQQAAYESLLTAMDPTYAAHRKLADEQTRLRTAMEAAERELRSNSDAYGKATSAATLFAAKSKELAQIQAELTGGHLTGEQALARVKVAMGGTEEQSKRLTNAVGLTKAQMQALSPQINDVISGLVMGQAPMTIFTQQSGQIVQALQAGGAEMPKFRASTLAMAGGIGIAAAAVAAIGVKMLQAQGQTRDFEVMLKAAGQQAVLTAQQVKSVADSIYDAGASHEDIASVLNSAISSRKFSSAAQLEEIGKLSVDLGVKMGGTAEAGKKLVEWLTSGVPGLQAMAKETEALTLAQYEAARAALEHGNKAQAQKVIIGALQAQFTGLHRDAMGPAEKAFHDLSRAYDDLVTSAANNPLVIKVVVQGGQTLTALAGLLKGDFNVEFPNPFGWALDQASGGNFTDKTPPQSSQPPTPQQKPQTFTAAGTFAARQSSVQSGMSASEQREISDLVDANNRLLEAMKKTGAERQVAVAKAQAEIAALKAGKSAYAAEAEGIEAARMARAQMAAGIADATAQLTIQARESLKVADAYMQSAAAGQAAEAMRQAQLDSLQSGVSAEQRYQEILNERAATQAATTAQALQTYTQEVAGREAVANATLEGVDAAYKAEMAEKVRVGTLAETIALENASGDAAEKLRKIIEAKTAAILDDERALKKQQIAQAIQQQKDQIELGQAQLRLMGASAEQRAVEIARLQAVIQLRNMHVDALSAEGQAYIANAENIARQQLETERLNAAYQELEQFGDQVFSSIIDSVVKGGDGTKTWANAVKGLVTEFETLALKMAVLNPIKNAVFGSNLPTIFDFGSMGGGSAANQNSGGLLSNGNALSLGSKFMPSSWTSGITSSIDQWGVSSLGIGQMTSLTPSASVQASQMAMLAEANPSMSAAEIAAGYQAPTAGTTVTGGLSAYLGAAGAGAAGGGLVGGILGTATNSKAIGGLSGAAAGAGSAYLASTLGLGAVGGPVGLAIGAIAGAIMGMIGTQKATVGKTASADVTINSGGKSATYGNILTDNEGDPQAGQALGKALSGIFSIAAMGGGSLTKDFGIGQTAAKGLYVGGSVPYKEFGKGDNAIGDALRYMLLDQGGLQGGGANTIAALKATKATDWDEAAKDVGLGAAIDAGRTALDSMVKTLSGVTDAAKKATTDSLAPMFDELARANKLGIGDAYKSLATDQLKAYLDQLRNPPDFTQVQTDMATLTGQFQAAREAYAQLDPAMVSYVDMIEKETRARVAANLNKSLDQQIAEASGRGYVNQISGFIDTLSANSRSLAAVGEPATRAQQLFNASIEGLLKTLTTDQLSDVTKTFGGDIGALATAMQQAATATTAATAAQEQAARFETLIGQIRQTNVQTEISALNEQKSAANSLLSSWKNLQSSIGQARQSLLVGDLSTLDPKSKMDQALSAYRDALGKAQGGDVDAAGQVSGLAQTALQAARAYYASSEDYARIFNEVTGGLEGVESAAARQVRLQSDTVSRLDGLIAVQQDALKALQVVPADIAAILKGINPSNSSDILTWSKTQDTGTQAQIKKAVLQSFTNDQIEAAFGGFSDIQAARAADPSFNLAQWFQTFGMNEVLNGQRSIPGFATGTDYAPGGLAWVGEKGPELMQLPTGSRIYPHAESMGIARSWGAANDRWTGVAEYRPRASSQSSGGMADPEMKALLREACSKLDALIRVNMGAGDKNIEGLREVAEGVSAVVRKVAGGDRR